jgi:hypothetical protein
MRFYPGAELNGDPTNWWGPNCAALEVMLRDVGFQRIECTSTLSPWSRLRGAIHNWIDRGNSSARTQDRVVYHAWK